MKTVVKASIGALMLAVGAQAYALDLTGATATWTYTPGPPIDNITETEVETITGYDVTGIIYKNDGAESGTLAGSYSGSFTDHTVTITYDGPTAASCPVCVLVIKDGNNDPNFYLFDLSTWNGTDTISVTGLWPTNGGSVSHFEIWGGTGTTTVPEPGSLALLGAGLLGLGLTRRVRRSR